MSNVGRLELRELVGALVDQPGPPEHDALALARVSERPRPVVEHSPRRSYRQVHVLRGAAPDLGDHPAIPRRHVVERPPVGGRDEPPVDERVAPQTRTVSRSTA
jgi:hypothetical protein